MRNFFVLLLTAGTICLFGACSKANVDSTEKGSGQHGSEKSADPDLISFVKTHKLANFQSRTIGGAFDSYKYLTNKEWKMEQQGGSFTVDFLGWLEPESLNDSDVKTGLTSKGIDIKFVIEPNGSYYVFMVSRLEAKSDGKIYISPYEDISGILASIYANKRISL